MRIGLVAAMFMLSSVARAERDPVEVDAARALFKEGKELRQDGDLQRSLEKFRSAHDHYETPITTLELGRAYILVGKLLEGRQVLSSVATLPPRPSESEKAADARDEAQDLIARVQPRLAWVSVATQIAAAAPAPRVFLDGALFSEKPQTPRAVNPGKHTLTGESGDAHARIELDLREGERRTVTMTLTPPGAPPPLPDRVTPEPTGSSPLLYVGFGLAGVGLAVGTVTGIISLSKASAAKPSCVDHRCPPEVHDDVDTAKTMGTVSTVAFAAGGVGLAGAIVALVWLRPAAAPKTSALASLTPLLGLGTIGLKGLF